jgi:hypothetical protein
VRGAPDQDIRDIDNLEIVFANGLADNPELLLSRVKGLVGWVSGAIHLERGISRVICGPCETAPRERLHRYR